ncbi:uncharacterized protein SCHCODRAFT_02611267 [Schizophyllum commune H4-8]|uniref:uncharacterized protein n=1 Tax=Schizophyllum commune (strain H4-8 / FGSC 9210) TaxID=578458 RepID=UPI00215DF650|nr:uncharacterized protein SCHCODRAFT_02611267 [Schizophyllum commune H4-8]KAI5898153.1 hypothetical protein SCHCODRAFT_02611267 [Schizophyllum commune H4-8]
MRHRLALNSPLAVARRPTPLLIAISAGGGQRSSFPTPPCGRGQPPLLGFAASRRMHSVRPSVLLSVSGAGPTHSLLSTRSAFRAPASFPRLSPGMS